MKILVVFIDMVRVTELNLFNGSKPKTLLDRNLKKIGGTLFTRCYTPGPDTPRSNACMQTGLYPYFNGCDTRIKWPKFFIKEEVTTIFDHAEEQGYTINACVRKHTLETGLLKYNSYKHILFYDNYPDFFEKAQINENTLSFVYDPDWHTAVSDYQATRFAFKEGDRVVSFFFERYLTREYINKYDYVLIYSDHGFQYQSESKKLKSSFQLLDDSRNQILLMIHKKGDTGISKDSRLASMLDVYATIEDLLDRNDFRQGYSLLRKPERQVLHIEDHQDFKVYPEVMIKLWRVISDSYDVRTDARQFASSGNTDDFKVVDAYLREFSPKYTEYVKQLDVWKHYAELSNDTMAVYVIGEKRGNHVLLAVIKSFVKIKSRVVRLFGKEL